MNRYRDTFEIFSTEAEARAFCDARNAAATPYVRRKHPAHYTEWSAPEYHYRRTEHGTLETVYTGKIVQTGFIAWYVC